MLFFLVPVKKQDGWAVETTRHTEIIEDYPSTINEWLKHNQTCNPPDIWYSWWVNAGLRLYYKSMSNPVSICPIFGLCAYYVCLVGHVVIYQLFYWKLLGSYFGAFRHQQRLSKRIFRKFWFLNVYKINYIIDSIYRRSKNSKCENHIKWGPKRC